MQKKKITTKTHQNKTKSKTSSKPRKVNATTKTQSKKTSKPFMIWVIAGAVLVVAIIAIVLFFAFKKDSDISTTKIMTKLAEKIPTVTEVVNFSEANDPNGIMGQENQYTSKSSWEDTRIPEHTSEYAGTIEVFNNIKDAELREWKLNKSNEVCKSKVTLEKYGSAVMSGWICDDYQIFRKNTVVVRLSSNFTNEQIAEYEKILDSIIGGFVIPDINTPSAERINELRNEAEASINMNADESEKELQRGLDEILSNYEASLDAIMENLSEDELADAKETLNFFKEASYYAPKIASLEQKIKNAEAKIAEHKQQVADAAAKAEQEKLAQKNRTLGAGKYVTCTDIDSGTYDVTALSGNGNLFVSSDNFQHYVNELMSATGSYGWNTEYKNMILSCGDILEIKNALTVQITAKR